MSCPVLATRAETVTISAHIENPSDRSAEVFYKVEVSGPMGREFRDQITVPPHQMRKADWTVNVDDVDLRYFIMTKITLFPFVGTRTREATCGNFVLDVDGLTGKQVLFILLAISVLGIIAGLSMWERQMKTVNKGPVQPTHVRRALSLAVLFALFSGLMGWWPAGIVFCVLAVLLLVTIVFGSRSA